MRLFRRQYRKRRCLVFAPLAYLKLQYLCHAGTTEIGAFGISADLNPLYITDLITIKQLTTVATVTFDDDAVADYFDQCVDLGLKPSQFSRLWLHTHPGASALPSGTDEETFRRVFGQSDWAVMAILSRENQTYARLQLHAGPGASCRLRWRVDWSAWPEELTRAALPWDAWRQEYQENIHPQILPELGRIFPSTDPLIHTNQLQELEDWYGSLSGFTGDRYDEPLF